MAIYIVGLIGSVASLSMNWVVLGSVGGLTVRPSDIFAGMLIVSVLCLKGKRPIAILTFGPARMLAIAFLFYLGALLLSLITGRFSGAGIALIAKHAMRFGVFLVLTELFLTVEFSRSRLIALLLFGSALGLAVFVAAATIMLGWKVIPEYTQAVVSGDIRALQFGFYPRLFSTLSVESPTSLRNALCGSFCVYFFVGTSAIANTRTDRWNWQRTVALLTAILSLFLVAASVSRSNLLILIAGIACFFLQFALALGQRAARIPRSVVVACLILMATSLAIVVPQVERLPEIATSYSHRVESIGSDGRVHMLNVAGNAIAGNWLLGRGAASTFQFQRSTSQFHNMILAGWYEAGLLGLTSTVFFCATIGILLLRFVSVADTSLKPSAHYWLAGLAFLPLVRTQVGGQGGMLSCNDWFALSVLLVFQFNSAATKSTLGYRIKRKRSISSQLVGAMKATRFRPISAKRYAMTDENSQA